VPNLRRKRKMEKRYDISAGARENLKDMWTYIAERNPTAAEKFMREFAKKFQILADNPKIGRAHNEHLLNLRSFPYNSTLDKSS